MLAIESATLDIVGIYSFQVLLMLMVCLCGVNHTSETTDRTGNCQRRTTKTKEVGYDRNNHNSADEGRYKSTKADRR